MMRRSDVEKEVGLLLNDLRTNDYIIPSLKMILSPVFSFLKPFYIMVVLVSFFSALYHGPHELWIVVAFFICDSIGIAFVTMLSILMMYNVNLVLLCISSEVKNKSLICNKWMRLIEKSKRNITIVSFFISLPFVIFVNWGFIVVMVSWSVLIIISAIIIGSTMSPYLTPEIVGFISKVRESGVVNFGEKKD